MAQIRDVSANGMRLRARFPADHGPRERWQHSGRVLELTERAGIVVVRATEEHVVDILVLRRWISASQREAALRLRQDFTAAGMGARVTGSYNPARTAFSPFGSWDERTDEEEAAYQRWRNALRALGQKYSDMVVTVCCHDQMPGLRHIAALRAGMALLVKYYRIPETEKASVTP